jgi:DNA polymerase III alpha subunit (gram-positive type)
MQQEKKTEDDKVDKVEADVLLYITSLDLETTGLSFKTDRFVQLGACIHLVNVTQRKWQLLASNQWLCRSDVPMHEKSIEVTHITQEEVNNAPYSADEVLTLFRMMVDTHCISEDIPRILLTYNGATFDVPFIICESARKAEGAENTYFRALRFTSLVDALPICRAVLDQTTMSRTKSGRCSFKLGEVYHSLLQKNIVNAHGGLADAFAVAEIVEAKMELFEPSLLSAARGEIGNGIFNIHVIVKKIMDSIPKAGSRMTIMDVLKEREKEREKEKQQKKQKIELSELPELS